MMRMLKPLDWVVATEPTLRCGKRPGQTLQLLRSVRMSNAVLWNACGAAMLEAVCGPERGGVECYGHKSGVGGGAAE
jgi:hypothetical protein